MPGNETTDICYWEEIRVTSASRCTCSAIRETLKPTWKFCLLWLVDRFGEEAWDCLRKECRLSGSSVSWPSQFALRCERPEQSHKQSSRRVSRPAPCTIRLHATTLVRESHQAPTSESLLIHSSLQICSYQNHLKTSCVYVSVQCQVITPPPLAAW
jgi:hypothetical protein